MSKEFEVLLSEDFRGQIVDKGICWSEVVNPNLTNDFKSLGTGLGNFNIVIQNLNPNTQYFVRAYASNEKETYYSDELSFETNNIKEIDFNGTIYQFSSDAIIFSKWGEFGIETLANNSLNGEENTKIISNFTGEFAAEKCKELNLFGYKGWFLPAIDELETLHSLQGQILPNKNQTYWSSTDFDGNEYAKMLFLNNGKSSKGYNYRDYIAPCICVRKK